ncbi:hypothetical protein Y032_0871g2795 [Ancylostoma ceylanicum]|uniref:Uncharacterized protein n=1 Tax=Ancylostoma ceylanicum TaxID=53326 RepID=A0A016WBI7_9BILA|nr:hypothetical protein Y032_0871g2795 [Ancylostoma ceylanicum]
MVQLLASRLATPFRSEDFRTDMSRTDIHNQYIKKLSELTKLQDSCLRAVRHQHYILGNFKETLTNAYRNANSCYEKEHIEKIRHEMTDAKAKLRQMESELPVQNNGFYLSLILGSEFWY